MIFSLRTCILFRIGLDHIVFVASNTNKVQYGILNYLLQHFNIRVHHFFNMSFQYL
jgi:hypothetical protein